MYSQNQEEKYILEAVADLPTGRFLDIGAYDGYQFSNTMALVERGWSGVLVEPGLDAFQALLTRHGGNRQLHLVHAAIGHGARRLSPFWNSRTTYSTTEKGNRAKWNSIGEFTPDYLTPIVLLEELFETFPNEIDVLSIDTEGTSVDLFLRFPFPLGQETHRRWIFPRVICVEHDGHVQQCQEHATRFGYRAVYQSAENLVFVR